jgi:hypothetical protein
MRFSLQIGDCMRAITRLRKQAPGDRGLIHQPLAAMAANVLYWLI